MSDQASMFDDPNPLRPWQGGPPVDDPRPAPSRSTDPETSRQAARVVEPKTGTWRQAVWSSLLAAGDVGLTDFELERLFPEARPQTVRTRRSELVRDGRVGDSGERRKTDSGSDAIVWKVTTREEAR